MNEAPQLHAAELLPVEKPMLRRKDNRAAGEFEGARPYSS